MDFNNREEVINKLKELKSKNLAHMTIEQFSSIAPSFREDIKQATEEEIKTIAEQLKPFYRAEDNNNCIFTGKAPSLQWGLAHGKATDDYSGLTWKCYHYFTINGKERRYERALQYHPDNYEIDEE